MNKKLNLSEKLDFSDIDLTAPDIVINELLAQLPDETNGLINGKIQAYDGPIMSYVKKNRSSIAIALNPFEVPDEEVDIQDKLGEIGTEIRKFECYLYTPEYEKYRYRMFFIKYDISNYPVTVVLEDSVAESISSSNRGYIYTCNSRIELENLILRILTSKRTVAVMQELIRVNQAKKSAGKFDEIKNDEECE